MVINVESWKKLLTAEIFRFGEAVLIIANTILLKSYRLGLLLPQASLMTSQQGPKMPLAPKFTSSPPIFQFYIPH